MGDSLAVNFFGFFFQYFQIFFQVGTWTLAVHWCWVSRCCFSNWWWCKYGWASNYSQYGFFSPRSNICNSDILSQFGSNLEGISHGMGSKRALPDYQFNVAEIGAETEDLPQQALELVHRIQRYIGRSLKNKWALITIVTGSEEVRKFHY